MKKLIMTVMLALAAIAFTAGTVNSAKANSFSQDFTTTSQGGGGGTCPCGGTYYSYYVFNNNLTGYQPSVGTTTGTMQILDLDNGGAVIGTANYTAQWRASATDKGCATPNGSTESWNSYPTKKYTVTVYFMVQLAAGRHFRYNLVFN